MRPAPKAPASSLVGHLFNRGGLAMKHKCALLCIALALTLMAVLATPAYALVPDGSQGWFWQMPQPAGGFAGLSAVTFPEAGNLWTVGAGGLILHSTDAGATWAAQPTGTDADLWSVSFPNDQDGWACGGSVTGSGGVILGTTDGGASWLDKTPAGLKDSLTNASFVSATHGWIGTTGGEILKTGNGGVSWTHVTLKSLFPALPSTRVWQATAPSISSAPAAAGRAARMARSGRR